MARFDETGCQRGPSLDESGNVATTSQILESGRKVHRFSLAGDDLLGRQVAKLARVYQSVPGEDRGLTGQGSATGDHYRARLPSPVAVETNIETGVVVQDRPGTNHNHIRFSA